MRNPSLGTVRLVAAAGSLFLAACAPDLIVKNQSATWNATTKSVHAEVVNIGRRPAGEFLVYFNGDENPVSANHRPQVAKQVPGLSSGASVVLLADFGPLAHPDNANLANVHRITIIADPKNMVREGNEGNNEAATPVP